MTIMKTVVVLVCAIATLAAQAPTNWLPRPEADDRVFGWVKVYNLGSATKPLTIDHRVYSPAQMTVANQLMNWIQQSYVPVGGLGDVLQWASPRMSPYNQYTMSLPPSYGAYAKIYRDLKPGAAGKIEPATDSHYFWSIRVNAVYGEPAVELSTPDQYYFTLPTWDERSDNAIADLEKAADVSQHPVLGRFPSYFDGRKFIVLSRGNRLPFVKLTKGEYLDALGAAIAYQYERERIRITQAKPGDKVGIARDMVYVDQQKAKRLATVAANRERYKGRLQEVATVTNIQPNLVIENDPDVFLGSGGSRIHVPVYKVDPALAELAKTGAPQWITVGWSSNLNHPPNKRLHDAIVNNFDFEFLYNSFFAPEKVAGRSYAPLRNPAAAAPVVTAAASAASKARAADPNVYFFDDFSTTPVGKPPIGWKSTLNNLGASSVVAKIDGMPGQWATTTGFTLTPGQLKTPLPADFTVTYDLVASADYTWGSRGMTFTLSNGAVNAARGSFVSLTLRPGSGSADGEFVIEAEFPKTEGYLSRSKWFKVPGFSNKAQSTVAVMLVKQGERLQVFLNKVKVFESEKAIPAGLLFNQLSMNHEGTFNANDRMFISNVTILKK
jgi:hypothetical protein